MTAQSSTTPTPTPRPQEATAVPEPLDASQLYQHCNPNQFSFETTETCSTAVPVVGQARAEAAIKFGSGIQQPGYNLFVIGPTGSGKYTAVTHYLTQKAAKEPVPNDWCYIHNFAQPHQPIALPLPPGKGKQLQQDMLAFVEEVSALLPAAYESEEYQSQRQAITEAMQQQQEDMLEAIKKRAAEKGIALLRTPNGLAFAPLENGEVISPKQFESYDEEKRQQIEADIELLQGELQKLISQVPQWSRQVREQIKTLDQRIATNTITPLITELRQRYHDQEAVQTYLTAVAEDVIANAGVFRQGDGTLASLQQVMGATTTGDKEKLSFFNRYLVNLLIDNSSTEGAPIVTENHPSYHNLVGRVEYLSQMGALVTDFTQIKAGAMHRANGGYLLLDARKVLTQPYAWESLKRILQTGEIRIESLGQSLGLISTVSLEPMPIPLQVKVVLMGERLLYYLLMQYDPEFGELFKVVADFEDEMPRTPENNLIYAQLMSTLIAQNGLRPFHKTAVARVIEHSARLAGDAQRLSTHRQSLADLLREADFWAAEAGHDVVLAPDVEQALKADDYRHGRLRDRMQEAILRETLLIDTTGEKVGQINGLSVIQLGRFSFGRPSRITARVRLGKGEVIDIERQVEMGGPIHSKGVLILSGFLGARYAAERPLSLSASLVFEQSYSGVDGDSASSAELYALLSALANVPIQQGLAVTGSVNQHGEVQAIGGVNEKIEGFFDVCRHRGLTGDQGVLIPAANVKNLMLRHDVVDAVKAGRFHIYPIRHVDEGIALLTGLPAGEQQADGTFPEGTINDRVMKRLEQFAQKVKEMNQPPPNGHVSPETAAAASRQQANAGEGLS
ncbi:MAG: ATP-binding protein [Candidatus Promineifilaceae bacterium]